MENSRRGLHWEGVDSDHVRGPKVLEDREVKVDTLLRPVGANECAEVK